MKIIKTIETMKELKERMKNPVMDSHDFAMTGGAIQGLTDEIDEWLRQVNDVFNTLCDDEQYAIIDNLITELRAEL